MAAVTKITQKTGIRYRVTINLPGAKEFSRNFRTMKNARAWAKRQRQIWRRPASRAISALET
jgi:hypothetical protein